MYLPALWGIFTVEEYIGADLATRDANTLDEFTDIRKLQMELKELGLEFLSEVNDTTTGPAHFILSDPDGNPILVDQHV